MAGSEGRPVGEEQAKFLQISEVQGVEAKQTAAQWFVGPSSSLLLRITHFSGPLIYV